MKINKIWRHIVMSASFLFLLSAGIFSCNKPGGEGNTADEDLGIRFDLPSVIELLEGNLKFTFVAQDKKTPKYSDKFIFESAAEGAYSCTVSEIIQNEFVLTFPDDIVSGSYDVSVSRSGKKQFVGKTEVVIVESADVELDKGTTVYGFVKCGTTPLEGVAVSDGYEVVVTDAKGFWQMKSDKANKYVFISVPSGYKVSSDGVLPLFYKKVDKKNVVERSDFYLVEDPGQDNHTMLFFGDMHLAGRSANDDRSQFYDFTVDVNGYMAENSGKKIYAMTLGDMTWDLYWYDCNYAFAEYLEDIRRIKDLQVFQTIGNHDHDMRSAGDFSTVTKYKEILGPTYYSFNIGKVHYVALDDIQCTNDGNGSRTYNDYLADEVMSWLAKDLALVPKSTPLVMTMHAPVYGDNGSNSLGNTSALSKLIDGYKEVHFVTGHTHKVYNVDKLDSGNIYEHNSGAVCATWWWTGKFSKIGLGQDGAPAGYRIMEVDGTDFRWQFKPTGKTADIQFRTYDRNTIDLTDSNWLSADVSAADKLSYYTFKASSWTGGSNENLVYINVWDYDPEWTVSVTENGKSLDVEKISAYDPLHIIAYVVPGLNKNSSKGFGTSSTRHFFRTKASSATSTLEIKVTDRFGRTYTETMTRPKEFSVNAYK